MFDTKGQHNFGEVIQLPTDAIGPVAPKLLFGAVIPRDNLRRDETRQILFGTIVHGIKRVLFSDLQQPSTPRNAKGLIIEAIDGSTSVPHTH